MIDSSPPSQPEPSAAQLLPIVVGAHLRAERLHRPLAYRLRGRMEAWLASPPESLLTDGDFHRLTPLVMTDLWYLNNDDLHEQPMIALGEPEVNAATAYLAARLPAAFVVEDTLRVQLDAEFIDLRACAWGAPGSESAAAAAVDAFIERYMEAWLFAAHEGM